MLKFIVYLFFIIIRNIGVKEVKELRQMLLCQSFFPLLLFPVVYY
ncbi:hypothetical protein PREVCOP_03685 [Segatella copri DSM 18205]|uniref:Uncharacterized protein n=1 Tax=Segatella copri DSM 18205 TaxID=537011 RepID=D1P929_9BACT|nr:hypothetical protein PREVCOP_03685 [Segatella copri DSM 18205]